MKNLALSLFLLITPIVVFSQQSRTELREKLQKVAIANDSLEAEVFELRDSLATLFNNLDSLKNSTVALIEQEIPKDLPTDWWGWIVLILGIAAKLVGGGVVSSVMAAYAKSKGTIKLLFDKLNVGDGRGFWILIAVCAGVSVIMEVINASSVGDFSLVHALRYFTPFITVAMALYHLGLKKFFEKKAA